MVLLPSVTNLSKESEEKRYGQESTHFVQIGCFSRKMVKNTPNFVLLDAFEKKY